MRRAVIGLVAFLLVSLAGGVAYASIPAGNGTIHGCYQAAGLGDGQVYVIDSGDECPSGFTSLNWDQTASSGLQGYEVVTETLVIHGPKGSGVESDLVVACPSGKIALGGGFTSDVVKAVPAAGGSGWSYDISHPSLGPTDQYNSAQSITCATEGT